MKLRSVDYALLSAKSYEDLHVAEGILVGGIEYDVMDSVSEPRTGFQAIAFQRRDTHDVVIAYRGTEAGREWFRDGIADTYMVLGGVNPQARAAKSFTASILHRVQAQGGSQDQGPDVTVTGHSLGGTLAQINASTFGLRGETFNAYGAAGLNMSIPEGGTQVVNHVRSRDPVSAASAHFGSVRTYALQKDVDALVKSGYTEDRGPHNLRMINAVDFDSHAIMNFVPNNDLIGQSILTPANEARYRANHDMVERYRSDVFDVRKHASVAWETRQVAIDGISHGAHSARDAGTYLRHEAARSFHETRQEFDDGLSAISHWGREVGAEVAQSIDRAGHAWQGNMAVALATQRHPAASYRDTPAPAPPIRLDRPEHPDHLLFSQARKAVHLIDAEQGRAPDRLSENLAASLVVAARREGMTRIDFATLSDDARHVFAVQGDPNSPFKRSVEVSTEPGINTSIDKNSAAWESAMAQSAVQAATLESSRQQAEESRALSSPSMSR